MTTPSKSTCSYPYWPISLILSIVSIGGALHLIHIVDKNLRVGLWSLLLEFSILAMGFIFGLCSWAFLSIKNKNMSTLPQHISERFDKEFGVLMVDEGPDAGFEYFTHFPNVESIKSFIATILDEEKVRILQERDITISMLYRNWKRRPLEDATDFDDVIAKLSIQ